MSEELQWQELGLMDVGAIGKLPLKHIPADPGVYKVSVGKTCYIGQAINIRNRVYEYHRPTQGIEHEQRLHRLLRKAEVVSLAVIVGPEMRDGATRRAIELKAWKQAEAQGVSLLNVSRNPKQKQYEMLLQYHEVMAEEYRVRLRLMATKTNESL